MVATTNSLLHYIPVSLSNDGHPGPLDWCDQFNGLIAPQILITLMDSNFPPLKTKYRASYSKYTNNYIFSSITASLLDKVVMATPSCLQLA